MRAAALPAIALLAAACLSAPGREPPAEPPRGLDLHLPSPEDDRPTPRRAALGRRLFFDPALSRDSTVACASCHRPDLGFADTLPRSAGVGGRTPARATPTLVNRGYGATFFWDGRAASLEEAVLLPIENPAELDLPLDSLAARLAADASYARLFREAYTISPSARSVGRALASYVRLIRSGDAPLDRHLEGEPGALPPDARRGRRLFLGRAGCSACHLGPNLTDESFHNTGVSARAEAGGEPYDPGREAVTGRPEDRGAFKTPTLREAASRPPFMHDGSLPTLEAVVRFYVEGGFPEPDLDAEIRPLELTESEIAALVAFLEALGGTVVAPGPDGRPTSLSDRLADVAARRSGRAAYLQ